MQTVTLSLYRFGPWTDRAWAFAQMGLARLPLARVPGLRFHKLLGVGTGEGFTPVPDTGRCAILAVWDDAAAAERGLSARVFGRYAARARETCTLRMETVSARGAWSGRTPFAPGAEAGGPVAAITRATLRKRTMLRFWQRVPDISAAIGRNTDVLMKVGIGEVPWFHQATFSIWPDAAAMAGFARRSGPHAEAIRAVREGDWFAEELYARFRIADASGTWRGRPVTEILA